MKILALEFSSARRSVALVSDLVGTTEKRRPFAETSDLHDTGLSLIDRVLHQANVRPVDIDVIAIGLGPGSYTGIRSAIAIAQGWQFALRTKLLGISSAKCIAAEALKKGYRGEVTLIIDAQRKEIYEATYLLTDSDSRELTPLRIVAPSSTHSGRQILGPEASRLIEGSINLYPTASTLGEIALARSDYISGERLEPIYLREISFAKASPPRTN
jgi:tRNA threonylcarbamoyladenosine biosynthesis protein TsaB